MSVLSKITAARAERVQDLHLDLPIPTWNGDLVARLNVLPRPKVEAFEKKTREAYRDAEFFLSAVREIYVLDPGKEQPGTRMKENQDYVRIEDENGTPVLFTDQFAAMLGVPEITNPVEVLRYCVKSNDTAIGNLVSRYGVWIANTDAQVAETVTGE